MGIKKIFGIALSGAILSGTLAIGFLANPAGEAERSIKVWFGRENFIPDDQFATFRKEYPDINVEYEVIRLEDVNAQLILAMRSGNAPDIVQIHSRDVEQQAINKVVKDFTHRIEEFKERFPKTYGQLAPLTWEGRFRFQGQYLWRSLVRPVDLPHLSYRLAERGWYGTASGNDRPGTRGRTQDRRNG